MIESPGRFLDTVPCLKISLVILSPPLLTRDVHIVTNNSFCDTCYIFSIGRKLMCIVSWDFHSLSIGTFCIVSDFFFPFWTALKVFLQFPMSFSSMVYIFPALVLSVASSSVNALIHFLTSQLFIPVTNMQKISSLFNTH